MNSPGSLTLWQHLEELRKRLLVSLAAVGVVSIAAYACSDLLLGILLRPVAGAIRELYFFSPAEAFLVKLQVAFLAGLTAAFPIVASQAWFFVSPGLHEREKRIVIPAGLVTSVLFAGGAVFCYRIVVPAAVRFFLGMQSEVLRPLISVREYVDFLTQLLVAFGVAFNLPVFVMALVFAGVTDAARLGKFRRHAVVLILVAAAVLTPGPDVASQFFLAVPLVFLFELSIAAASLVGFFRKGKKP
ncbi:MAG: twin-arginine translocase subunit TatC [Candidatus Omnitrophica bacterium]|nr:twin-arginine translocase subunit TatC [Candidatus Omnitrophota bacterium]